VISHHFHACSLGSLVEWSLGRCQEAALPFQLEATELPAPQSWMLHYDCNMSRTQLNTDTCSFLAKRFPHDSHKNYIITTLIVLTTLLQIQILLSKNEGKWSTHRSYNSLLQDGRDDSNSPLFSATKFSHIMLNMLLCIQNKIRKHYKLNLMFFMKIVRCSNAGYAITTFNSQPCMNVY
jgi:hypothetical protein